MKFKLWETEMGRENYIFFSSVDEYLKYMEENSCLTSYKVKDNYNIGSETEDLLDEIAEKNSMNLIYTDDEHPIAFSKDRIFNTYISSSFFEKNKEKFKEYELKKLQKALNEKSVYISFPNIIFNDEILKLIINSNVGNSSIVCYEVDNNFNITENQRKFLQDNHIEFKATYRFKNFEQVSTNKLISDYTFDEFKASHKILITLPIEKSDVDKFIYANDKAVIELDGYERDKYSLETNRNEINYFNNIIEIMDILKTHNKNYNLKIEVTNRQVLEKSNLLNLIPNNINLIINSNNYDYDIKTYKEEEKKLEKLVSNIKNSNLTSFEKYLACYNIAKKFKPYKENSNDKKQSRYLKYILEDDNEYIVCLGFSNLLKALLDKVGIQSKVISVDVDVSYDDGFTIEDKPIDLKGHARNLIKIDDDKYKIHGYYLADSTWDNSMTSDFYTNALLTFEQKKGSKRLERLNNIDLILDFSDKNDFIKKINYYIKKEINTQKSYGKNEENSVINAYKEIYDEVLNVLYYTNSEKYDYFYKKYKEYFEHENIKLNTFESVAYQFLDEYADYILPLTNNKVDFDALLEGAIAVKKEVDKYTDDEIKEWLEVVKFKNQKKQEKSFPYDYKLNENVQGIIDDLEESKQK